MTLPHLRIVFRTAAMFNWLACILLMPGLGIASRLGFEPALTGAPWSHVALLAIALLGYGYWMVARDPIAHRGIIVLGLIGKLGVVCIMFGHYLLVGDVNFRLVSLSIGDLIYGALFLRALRATAHHGITTGGFP